MGDISLMGEGGVTTGSSTPSASARPCAKVVLPAPSSPERAKMSALSRGESCREARISCAAFRISSAFFTSRFIGVLYQKIQTPSPCPFPKRERGEFVSPPLRGGGGVGFLINKKKPPSWIWTRQEGLEKRRLPVAMVVMVIGLPTVTRTIIIVPRAI